MALDTDNNCCLGLAKKGPASAQTPACLEPVLYLVALQAHSFDAFSHLHLQRSRHRAAATTTFTDQVSALELGSETIG